MAPPNIAALVRRVRERNVAKYHDLHRTIYEIVAEALRLNGIRGGKISGSNITGQVPIGSALIIVQLNGVTVGTTYKLNFVGTGWIIGQNVANNSIDIGLRSAPATYRVVVNGNPVVVNGDPVVLSPAI